MVVSFSKANILLKFNFYRKSLEKHGFLKISDGKTILTRKYYNMMRDLLSSLHFYSIGVFFSIGTVPFWVLIGKLVWNDSLMGMGCLLLCFGIPFIFIDRFVVKSDAWLVYWNQIFTMSPQKRRKIIIYACLAKVGIWLLYFAVYYFCIPKINNM